MVESIKISARSLDEIVTNSGKTVLQLSQERPVLLIFLRHLGCVFCREALKDISSLKKLLVEGDQEIVFVHMEDNEIAKPFFEKYHLNDCLRVADTEQRFYQMFGLTRGDLSQLFGFKTMVRGFSVGISLDQFGGSNFGDAFQMPGIFVIHNGVIKSQYIHKTVSDRPDYAALLRCCK
jgi:peroxiredoxin